MDYESPLLTAMTGAYRQGHNAMEVARKLSSSSVNSSMAIEIAYDLQAGTYIRDELELNKERYSTWITQCHQRLKPYLDRGASVLEVGAGDGTTLYGIIPLLQELELHWAATDISFSRCLFARDLLGEVNQEVTIWSSDLFDLPLADDSVDVVFTVHALEPNGGREQEAIRELIRIARRAVILMEPIWELAPDSAKQRMDQHKYVRGLADATSSLGLQCLEYELLSSSKGIELNPSGILVIPKPQALRENTLLQDTGDIRRKWEFQCPLTRTGLEDAGDYMFNPSLGLAYPKIQSIPILRRESAVIATALAARD